MHIELLLTNAHGDELGRLPMQTVRLAASGVGTAPPDLAGEMAETSERISLALAQEGMVPTIDEIGLRLAVSRALLAASPDEVKIPITVRPLENAGTRPEAGPDTAYADASEAAAMGTTLGDDEWSDLFSLGDGNPHKGAMEEGAAEEGEYQ